VAALHPLVLEDLLHLAFGDVALGQHDFAELLRGDAQFLHLFLETEALVDFLQRGEAELDGDGAEVQILVLFCHRRGQRPRFILCEDGGNARLIAEKNPMGRICGPSLDLAGPGANR
jgi:hypothetical protein